MAATNFTPISLYYSTTASAVPTSGNLVAGELALNTLDEKLYFKNSAGTVKLLASNAASTGTVSSVAATVPSFLSIAGSPITTSGTLAFTLSGTALPTTSGGTGLTSFTSGGVVYASSSSALATGSALTFNGTDLTFQSAIKLLNSDGGGNKAILSTHLYGGSGATGTLTLSSTYGNANQTRIKVGTSGAAVISFENDSVENMRLSTSGSGNGNLLIGTTSSTFSAASRGVIEVAGSSTALVSLKGGSALAYIFNDGGNLNIQNNSAGVLQLSNNSAVRFQIGSAGQFGIGGATYGTAGQVLTSGGSGAAPTWAAAGGGSQAFVAFGTTGETVFAGGL